MTVRRTNATRTRKRPAQAPALDTTGAGIVTPKAAKALAASPTEAAINQVASDSQDLANDLLGQVDDLLRSDPSIEPQDREAFSEQFSAALRQVVDAGEYMNIDIESVLRDSVSQLKQYAVLVEAGSGDGDLARQVSNALAPLEQRKTKIALEFSRRLEADGQESALAWLREQRQADEQQAAVSEQSIPESNPLRSSPDEVTRSRSRRLRGPPTS